MWVYDHNDEVLETGDLHQVVIVDFERRVIAHSSPLGYADDDLLKGVVAYVLFAMHVLGRSNFMLEGWVFGELGSSSVVVENRHRCGRTHSDTTYSHNPPSTSAHDPPFTSAPNVPCASLWTARVRLRSVCAPHAGLPCNATAAAGWW